MAPRLTDRLYWRVWAAVLASLLLFALLAAVLWHSLSDRPTQRARHALSAVASAIVPATDAPPAALASSLAEWSRKLETSLAVYAADGQRLAATDAGLPDRFDVEDRASREWRGRYFVLPLADGRVLLGRREGLRRPQLGLLLPLALIALAVGAGAYPVVRRLTRRLERLQSSVERLGSGDLAARVPVEGRDEVAQLAASFNEAATRIQALVSSHRTMLANASHELRSPLARVRMAIEMLSEETGPARAAALKDELVRNVAELDALIDEILLAARLDAVETRPGFVDVDLTAIAQDECAVVGAVLNAPPLSLQGEPRLLRRLLRNLLENARRHGGSGLIEVTLQAEGHSIMLRVCDRGPGIPAEARERVFEPFYRLPGTPEGAGGSGLGLALVRKIAEQHGGAARCEPREGGGACFVVVLPHVQAGNAAP